MNPFLFGFSEYQTVCSKKLHKKCNEGKSGGGGGGREKEKNMSIHQNNVEISFFFK